VGVIQREIEKAGVSTVSISLVREFTAKVRPPRALWVPFPFGRPFGGPDNPAVQRRVILAALALLQRPTGPVLEDFIPGPGEELLDAKHQMLGRNCGPQGCRLEDALTADAPEPEPAEETKYDGSSAEVMTEITGRLPLHRRYRDKRRGRTQVGLSGVKPDDIAAAAQAVHCFVMGQPVVLPAGGRHVCTRLFVRHSIDDLKAFYMESRAEEAPGEIANAAQANDWLWTGTWVARLIIAARDRLIETTDVADDPNWTLARGIVPRGYGSAGYTLGHVTGE
jgi:antitoxin component of MazEF toxin-antitoxin module